MFAADGAIGGNIGITSGGTLKLGQSEVISNQSVITVNTGGVFDLNGYSETVSSLAGNGSVILSAGQKLAIDFPNPGTSSGSFVGIISGAGGLQMEGNNTPASYTLNGQNTYTGPTIVGNGTPSNLALRILTIANGGLASSIGASSNATANLEFDYGTLHYTGRHGHDRSGGHFHPQWYDAGLDFGTLTLHGHTLQGNGDINSDALIKSGGRHADNRRKQSDNPGNTVIVNGGISGPGEGQQRVRPCDQCGRGEA